MPRAIPVIDLEHLESLMAAAVLVLHASRSADFLLTEDQLLDLQEAIHIIQDIMGVTNH